MIVVNSPPAAAGGGAAGNEDFTRVDVTDGTWTKYDNNSVGSNISNTAGINSVDLTTTATDKIINGCVWYKELTLPDGADFNFTDKPVDLRGYVHLPETGWRDSSGATGGLDRPAVASKTYCVLGFMTDPENLPTSGTGPWPRDICGAGLEWQAVNNRLYRTFVRNTSNSGTYGAITANRSGLQSISASDVAAGHKACNRISWSTQITSAELTSGGALTPAGIPESYYMQWGDRYDNGDKRIIGNYSLTQRWGRTRTTKLYVWVACGRGVSGAGAGATMRFDAYYNAQLLTGGNNPSGTTGL